MIAIMFAYVALAPISTFCDEFHTYHPGMKIEWVDYIDCRTDKLTAIWQSVTILPGLFIAASVVVSLIVCFQVVCRDLFPPSTHMTRSLFD